VIWWFAPELETADSDFEQLAVVPPID